jgi:hypothetical protein
MNKSHRYIQNLGDSSFKSISPFLQEKMAYAGQFTNYHEGVSLLETFYGINISQTQHFRLTNHYGEFCASVVEKERPAESISQGDNVYVQCDGSMILTRENNVKCTRSETCAESVETGTDCSKGSWQEVKLCRVFRSSDNYTGGKRHCITSSRYVAHIGGHVDFQEKAERLIDPYENLEKRLVFISEYGASWIHKWQSETYPKEQPAWLLSDK